MSFRDSLCGGHSTVRWALTVLFRNTVLQQQHDVVEEDINITTCSCQQLLLVDLELLLLEELTKPYRSDLLFLLLAVLQLLDVELLERPGIDLLSFVLGLIQNKGHHLLDLPGTGL